jgi:Holliday junction resolvase-like predicted endonuclease
MESKIQHKIIKKLESDGYFVLKLIRTNKSGIMDLIAMKKDIFFFIEVKQPKGRLSEIQKYRISELKKIGIDVFVCYDENIENILTNYGNFATIK